MSIAITIGVILIMGTVIGALLNFTGSFLLGIPLVLIFIGAVVGKETLERQSRIQKMKRYRNTVRAPKAPLSAEDKRTLI